MAGIGRILMVPYPLDPVCWIQVPELLEFVPCDKNSPNFGLKYFKNKCLLGYKNKTSLVGRGIRADPVRLVWREDPPRLRLGRSLRQTSLTGSARIPLPTRGVLL